MTLTTTEKLEILNNMHFIDADFSCGEVVYVLVDYTEENIQTLALLVPDVDVYMREYGDPEGRKEDIDISGLAFFHIGADYYKKGKFYIEGNALHRHVIERSQLTVKRKPYKAIDQDGERFVTYFENEGYVITVHQRANGAGLAYVSLKNRKLPNLSSNGVKVGAVGTLPLDEIDAHIERVVMATETYKQLKAMDEKMVIR